MPVTKNQRRLLFTVVASLNLLGSEVFTLAQQGEKTFSKPPVSNKDAGTEELPARSNGRELSLKGTESTDGTFVVISFPADAAKTLEGLATLDDVRAVPIPEKPEASEMDGRGGSGMPGGMDGIPGMAMGMGMGGMGMSPPPLDARQIAMKKVYSFRRQLASPKADRAEVENKLRSALSEYFIADLQHRVKELDAVKARVQQMEARLQKRLDLKKDAIDLQFKRMQYEADGLEFVIPDESDEGMSGGGTEGGYGMATGEDLPRLSQ